MIKPAIFLLSIFLFFTNFKAHCQKLQIKNYSFGYKVFEIDAIGNDPETIWPFLKNPQAYLTFLKNFTYNGSTGSGYPQRYHNYYIDTELYKKASYGFWRKTTLALGFVMSNKIVKDPIGLDNHTYEFDPAGTTTDHYNRYWLTQQLQFFGAEVGINRRFRIVKNLQFLTGLHYQGSFAFVHHYKQQIDTSTYVIGGNFSESKTTYLPNLAGTHFYQWQAMIPLGLEYNLYKNILLFRVEGNIGIVGNHYKVRNFAAMEAHGAGVVFIYQPK